jgi:hypothetical protein
MITTEIKMIPSPDEIKPKVRGKSDFFSWQLYRYMLKYKSLSEQRIWSSTWNSCYGVDREKPSLFIGSERDGCWIHARQLRNLCLSGQKIERYAHGAAHDTKNWTDVTDAFWSDYLKKGVCAIHGDNAHNWSVDGDLRACEYCGKKERRIVSTQPVTRWFGLINEKS